MTDAIRKLLDARKDAYHKRDPDLIAATSSPDAILFTFAPPLRSSPSMDELKSWLDTWTGPIAYDMQDLRIETESNLAFCTSLSRMRGTKTSGETIDMWFRETLGLRKIDDRWTIVHEHTSVPFYMDGSLKAAVDLKP